MRDEYEITTSIQMLIDDDCPVYTAEVVSWDMNITEPADLLVCNRKWLEHKKLTNIIEAKSSIHPRARISGSAVGRNVRVAYPIKIKNSVLMDNAAVKSKNDISNCLVSENSIIKCAFSKK